MTESTCISIMENDSCPLCDEDLAVAREMISSNPEWKCTIEGNSIQFGQYMIGSVVIGNTQIEIKPRNRAFTLGNYFEMMLYVHTDKFNFSRTSGYQNTNGFGLNLITTEFLDKCKRLINFGITGSYVTESHQGNIITGEINLDYFSRVEIPYAGVCIKDDQYLLDVVPNQVLKAALEKLALSLRSPAIRGEISLLLKYFSNVSPLYTGLNECRRICNSFYSANPYYPIALEFAFKILTEIKVKYGSGGISWNAFIFNSNDIFEKYVRKVLNEGLKVGATKWQEPKQIASLEVGSKRGLKSYSPDILVGYNPSLETAMAVLDAKNKKFNLNERDISDVLDSADMYQLIFYCDRLHTKLGGLIYPSMSSDDPVKVIVEGNNDYRLMLFSINFSLPIKERNAELIRNIENNLMVYS